MRKLAFIGTGGTIAALGKDPFDVLNYNANNMRLAAPDLIARTGLDGAIARIDAVDFQLFDSTSVTLDDWAALAGLCGELASDGGYAGIVIGHGTSSLEETAWCLSLVLDLPIPVVLTGAMRPFNAISSDGVANIAAALRVAGSKVARGCGVLVVMNDEIHTARDVAKTENQRLNAFRSVGLGPLGYVIGDAPTIERTPRPVDDRLRFTPEHLAAMPRVDLCYSHVGADATAIEAFVAAGARGIVSGAFSPGLATPAELTALAAAARSGIIVVQSSRVASGPVVDSRDHRQKGIIAGGSLSPQKARILLGLCLARGDDHAAITATFKAV